MKKNYLYILFLICIIYACSNKDDPVLKPKYDKGDTLVYIPFNHSFQDQSKWSNPVAIKGNLNYLTGINKQPENAGFFNHSACLQLDFDAQDSMEISFWFAPFRLSKGASIIDCLDNLLSVYISDVNTGYIDAYSAATYTLSAGIKGNEDLNVNADLEAKPYPTDTTFFDDHTVWHHVQIFMGANSNPLLVLNSQSIGEISTIMNPVAKTDRITVTIGAEKPGKNYFCGKIDEFIIRNLKE